MPKNIILATIYKLVFKHNTNIAYVGQSTNINSRFKQHIKNANDFSNIDNKLYFFMNLYGIHNFYIEVIEIFNNISQIELNNNEKKYIQLYGSINTTYSNSNISIQITKSLIEQLVIKLQDDNISENIITQISNSLYNKYSITTLNSSNNTIEKLNDNKNTVNLLKEYPTNTDYNQLSNSYNITHTNTDSVALKKLRNAEYQRKYRAKLTQQQLITLNSSKASTNRNRYNTDPDYKFNKNLYNKNKAKDNRNKAKLYDSIIDSTLTPTDTTQPLTDTTQPLTDTIQPPTDTIQPLTDTTQPLTDTTQPLTDTTQPLTDTTQPLTDTIQPPTDTIQPLTDTIQPSTDIIQSPTDNIQSPTDNIQSPTDNIQSPTDQTQT